MDHLTFHMGEFEARFPTDRRYAKNHMWAKRVDSGTWRFGFSAYAVRLLQDVYFLEWTVDAGTTLDAGAECGFIESSKAESELYMPMGGQLAEFNEQLLADPSTINLDNYGGGWLFRVEGDGADLLSPEDYLAHLESVWELTQRTIKGQLNE